MTPLRKLLKKHKLTEAKLSMAIVDTLNETDFCIINGFARLEKVDRRKGEIFGPLGHTPRYEKRVKIIPSILLKRRINI